MQSRTNVRADDELDALDLRLDEHDSEMLLFRRVRVGAQQLHVARLELNRISWSS